MEIHQITSARNEKVKRWRKLSTRKGREEFGSILIEGEKLLKEAVCAGWQARSVIVSDEGIQGLEHLSHLDGVSVYAVYPSIFSQLVDTQTPQGIAAEVMVPVNRAGYQIRGEKPVLLLDAIQDPGNLGAILRTAEAAGVGDVWLGAGTVDPYNPKVVRSAMGSLFRSRIRRVDLREAIPELKEQGYWVVGTNPRAERVHFDCHYPKRTAILLGNEGRGISAEIDSLVDDRVRIPMPGQVESLNVSVTAGILLFELLRQKWRET